MEREVVIKIWGGFDTSDEKYSHVQNVLDRVKAQMKATHDDDGRLSCDHSGRILNPFGFELGSWKVIKKSRATS